MPLPTNVHAYNDVRAVLDAAVANDGARYTLPTAGAAVRFRQRAYMLRKLMRNKGEATPYDDFVLLVEDCSVIIRPTELHNLTDLEGNPIEPAAVDEDDGLLEEARKLNLPGRIDFDL